MMSQFFSIFYMIKNSLNNKIKYYCQYLPNNFWVFIFFISLFLLGLAIYKDYGVSWDEHVNRTNGLISLNYVIDQLGINLFSGDTELAKFARPLNTYNDRDYGVVFDLPVAFIERFFSLNNIASQYHLRHFLTFLIFILGAYSVYMLASRRFNNWRFGLLAALMLVLSPRFFAEGFYNSKDLVFMSFFALSLNTAIYFLQSPNLKTSVFHALTTALATDIRVVGAVVMFITLGMLLIRLAKREFSFKDAAIPTLIYVLLSCAFTIAFWPWLWSEAWLHINEAIHNMAKFRWTEYNLYLGEYIEATRLPWHYILVWIGVTTPLMYLIAGFTGCLAIIRNMIKKWSLWTSESEMQDFLFISVFIGAISSVIILRSVLYDGWRHMYFIYPVFILISIRGIAFGWKFASRVKITKIGAVVLLISCFIYQANWMYVNHPLQNLYFNLLAGLSSKPRFDLDYWGLSNQFALKYILENDNRPQIAVMPISDNPLFYGLNLMTNKDRNRIIDVHDDKKADYLVNNYRFLKGNPYLPDTKQFENVYEILVDNQIIISVFKRK